VALLDRFRRRGRPPAEPARETDIYPRLMQLGQARPGADKPAYKPTNKNLRYFGRTSFARRAINAIKNPIAQLQWEIVPLPGVKPNSELKRQIEIAWRCFDSPNGDDSFRTLTEQVLEDILHGAGAIEQQLGGDDLRPLWLWPVDGLSINIYPGWAGGRDEARYVQTIGYGSVGGGPEGIKLRDEELIYIRPNPSTAQPFGTGPLEVAFTAISRQLGTGTFAGNVATNAKPSTMIYAGKVTDANALAAARSWWTNEIEGQGKTPLVSGEAEWKAIRLFPDGDSALFLGYQEFLIHEIATAFDLSPQNLGLTKNLNRSNAEVAEDRDWDQAIKPWAHLLEQSLTRQALHKRLGFSQLMFRFIGLDRDDEEATARIYEIYYKNNAILPNEQREKLGWKPGESRWMGMTAADVAIAGSAARGAKEVDDPDIRDDPAPKPTRKAAGNQTAD
jgi:hypothetical protein